VTRPRWGHTRDGQPVHAHVRDHLLPHGSAAARFNSRVAQLVTDGVSTMWCAYAFALFDCLALPTAIRGGMYGIVQWVASFFLQLVLLSIVMVKQTIQDAASDARAAKTFEDTERIICDLAEVLAAVGEARQDYARTIAAISGAAGGGTLKLWKQDGLRPAR